VGDGLARSLALFDGDEAQVIAPESLLLPEGELPIYEKVRIHSRVTTDIPDVDAHTLFFEHGRGLKKLSDTASVEAGVEIRLEDPSLTDHVMAKLKKMGVGPAEDWKMRNSILLYSLKTERRLMSTFLALTIVVSAFSIVGVLMVLVAEKRADIGILKSMGAQDEQVRSIFMKAGLALGWRGILGGVIGGLLIVGALKYPNLIKLPDIYLDTSLPVVLNPWVITGIVIFGLLLVILGAWIPSRQATRYSPLDALKGRTN
ncbi:MAG: ABC transporter permease, partial [Oligoflexia bacterium]|nr:ABC transporter permease [Oligoflexia bacterium]